MKTQYAAYMMDQNVEGSNKASSYIRALELLTPILERKGAFSDCADIYSIQSVERVDALYEYILEQQRLEDDGIFGGEEPSSYWRNRYYSAAIRSYKEFLIVEPYLCQLRTLFHEEKDSEKLTERLMKQEFRNAEYLVQERGIDFSSREGKDKVRAQKTRVNQDFFREMILEVYNSQCCLTGINVPGVLRASHIIGWADDEKNRLNPANGLCLSATYDAAFDRHLISFDEDFRLIFSPVLKEYYNNKAFQTQFKAFEGQRLSFPNRFNPSQIFLIKHREKMLQ